MSDVVNLAPPVVDPIDEARRPSGSDPLWNESWYFDVADADRELGAYLRFGLYPNRNQTWFQLNVAGRDRPLTVLVDETAPLPIGDDLAVARDSWSVQLFAEVPLERWRVTASGIAAQFDDPLAVYRREGGTPIDVEVDLTWQTASRPYHYGLSDRYEVSAHVTGSIRVGTEVIAIDAPGQRDHSWGVRDWWAFGWCWSAGSLDDGTAFHLSDIRFPSQSTGFGYVTGPDGTLGPATRISAVETLDDEGLPTSATLALDPAGLTLSVEPIAFSPVLFTADDGRTSRLPRALCRYTSADGRTGVGWTEWNQLQDRTAGVAHDTGDRA